MWIVTDVENVAATTLQITFDGDATHINGAPDWVYEEEILESNSASYWAPDSRYIAFLRFEQSQTPIYEFTIYNSPNTYPETYQYRYPCVSLLFSISCLNFVHWLKIWFNSLVQ